MPSKRKCNPADADPHAGWRDVFEYPCCHACLQTYVYDMRKGQRRNMLCEVCRTLPDSQVEAIRQARFGILPTTPVPDRFVPSWIREIDHE